MKKSLLLALTFMIFSGIYSSAKAQSESITFINESGKSSSADPRKLKSITIKAIGHDLKTHEFSGPLLSDFLSNTGVILGEPAKKQPFRAILSSEPETITDVSLPWLNLIPYLVLLLSS
jgi:hypothetical protein